WPGIATAGSSRHGREPQPLPHPIRMLYYAASEPQEIGRVKKPLPRVGVRGVLAIIVTTAFPPAAQAQTDSGGRPRPPRPPYTAADVHFMSGMMLHHAQAVLMAGRAPTHGARPFMLGPLENILLAH